MIQLIHNYHTHTYRCGHACGTEEEYILRAIDGGIKYMGFSDHMAFEWAGKEASFRVPVAQAKEYCDTIKKLAEKYRDKIEIRVGFEMEYYRNSFRKMLENAVSYGAEYLILGPHCLEDDYPEAIHTYSLDNDDVDFLEKYVSLVTEAMKTGVFTYVAHPDIITFTGDTEVYCEKMRKICVASRECGVPLEINFLGIREGRIYPHEEFWKIAGEEQSPVTFGFDAHDVQAAFDGESLKKAEMLVEKYNLNYIGMPEIVDIRELLK